MTTGGKKEMCGIFKSHAYSLIKAVEVTISRYSTEKLVQIRNPWGGYEWTGDWSDKSPLWTEDLKELLHHEDVEDGCFYMKFDDYYSIFAHTFICKVSDDYIHQHIVVKEHEAMVAFQLDSYVKGFFNVNHLNPRMMESLNISKKGEILVNDLRRYEDNRFNSVCNPQGCDALGIASLGFVKEGLGPGIYVMRGYYYQGKTPNYKFLNFQTYCNEAINMVHLKGMTKFEEINIQILKERLKKDSRRTAAFIPNAPKRAPSLTHCPNGHELQYKVEKSSQEYKCNICSKRLQVKLGRYNCRQCTYDVCTICRPAPVKAARGDTEPLAPMPSEKKQEPAPIPPAPEPSAKKELCAMDHELKWVVSPEREGEEYYCISCGRAFGYSIYRWGCIPCDYDICYLCIPPPPGASIEAPKSSRIEKIQSIDTCPYSHPLNYEILWKRQGYYNCKICHKSVDSLTQRWICRKCNYEICPNCKPAPSKGAASAAAPDPAPRAVSVMMCNNMHKLCFTSYCYLSGLFRCDKCNKEGDCKEGRWSCIDCEFDICTECRDPPAEASSENPKLCDNMHYMTFSSIPYSHGSFFRCNLCQRAIKASVGRWWCPICAYDLCSDCASGKKIAKTPLPPPVERGKNWCKDNKHFLVRIGGKNSDESVTCDICSKSFPGNSENYQCGMCGFITCLSCSTKINQVAPPAPVPAYESLFPQASIGSEYMIFALPEPIPASPYYNIQYYSGAPKSDEAPERIPDQKEKKKSSGCCGVEGCHLV